MSSKEIPARAADVSFTVGGLVLATDAFRDEVAQLDPGQLHWKPEGKWSVIQHMDHLSIVHEPYVDVIEKVLDDDPPEGPGPYRHPWFGTWFANSMKPPPKRRWRTMPVMVPAPDPDPDEAVRRFTEVHDRLGELMKSSEGVDLGRARFASPFSRWIRLSLGTAYGTIIFHVERHLWLAREVIGWEGFPTPSDPPSAG